MSKSREEIIAKIKKLFALSKSPNAHEAATALRMAQRMMQEYAVAEHDVDDDAITEAGLFKKRWDFNVYRNSLTRMIANAFGVECIFKRLYIGIKVVFIGPRIAAEIATYAYQVLLTQLERDRKKYLCRVKKVKNRQSRGDAFSLAWIAGACDVVGVFTGKDCKQEIEAFIDQKYPSLETTALKPRTGALKPDDRNQGFKAGKNAQLHRGVAGTSAQGDRLQIGVG